MPMMEKVRDRFLFSVSELSANKAGATHQAQVNGAFWAEHFKSTNIGEFR